MGRRFIRDVEEVKARYAEEVAFTDLHIGRLLAYLDEHLLWDSTCVVFVADHGEEFLEHGGFEHGSTVFEEVLHVPLFIADPARDGPAAIDEPVETRWLFGTILDMAGVRRPAAEAATPNLFAPPQGDTYQVRGSLYNPRETCLLGVAVQAGHRCGPADDGVCRRLRGPVGRGGVAAAKRPGASGRRDAIRPATRTRERRQMSAASIQTSSAGSGPT